MDAWLWLWLLGGRRLKVLLFGFNRLVWPGDVRGGAVLL